MFWEDFGDCFLFYRQKICFFNIIDYLYKKSGFYLITKNKNLYAIDY